MIPFCNGNAFLSLVNSRASEPETLDADYAWHLKNAPIPTPDPWPIRLLPAFLRTRLKARAAAQSYEKTLINLWETSPHLLDDIGVVLSTDGTLPENHVAAPDSVIGHVKASKAEQEAAAAALALQGPATVAPVPATAVLAQRPQRAIPSGLPA